MELLPDVDPLQLISRAPAIFDTPMEDIKVCFPEWAV